jgi:hypothetical protein
MKKMKNKIQYEASRIVSGASKLVSLHKLKREGHWESLESRRREHKLILLYKMKNGLSPNYLSSLVRPSVGETSRYNLRNSNDFKGIRTRTSLYYNAFLPSALRDWNDLPSELQNAPSLLSFKSLLNSDLSKCPKYFYTGIRKWQIPCTPLNYDLFREKKLTTVSMWSSRNKLPFSL